MDLPVIIAVGCAGLARICVLIIYGTLLICSGHVVHQCFPQLLFIGICLLNVILPCTTKSATMLDVTYILSLVCMPPSHVLCHRLHTGSVRKEEGKACLRAHLLRRPLLTTQAPYCLPQCHH